MSDEDDEKKNGLSEEARNILSKLTAREAIVLRERFGVSLDTDFTLEEIGKQFDVTRERIRKIEEKALRKLRHKDMKAQPSCSFCGRPKDEVEKLITSELGNAYICKECIKASLELLDE